MKALLDTNILIDYLNGVLAARKELDRYESRSISIVTWMEVLAGGQPEDEAQVRQFLANFDLIDVDGQVAERAVALRRSHRIKLPDAIIWATAQVHSMLLVTRNEKDFPADMPGVRFPYRHPAPQN